MTGKQPPKKGAAKAAPLRQWESRYPEYPNLLDDPAVADTDAVLSAAVSGEYWAMERLHAALMLQFVRQVNAGEHIETRHCKLIASALSKVLLGAAWEEAFRLPGREMGDGWDALHPLDLRDLAIYHDVESREGRTTERIRDVASAHAVSFETARAAYYAWKSRNGDVAGAVSKMQAEK